MKIMNKMTMTGCLGILFAAALMSSCSSNDDPTPAQEQDMYGPPMAV